MKSFSEGFFRAKMVIWGAYPFSMLTCEQEWVGRLSSLDLADTKILVFPIGETYRCNILVQYKASSSVYSYISITCSR